MLNVNIKLGKGATLPRYATKGAAGFDISASQGVLIMPGQTVLIPTGLFAEIPEGYEMQIRLRSSTAYKTDLVLKNSPGTIDSDYRGEIKLIIKNNEPYPYEVKPGDRLCQGVIKKAEQVLLTLVDELSDTVRGDRGFGHTGTTYNASNLIN